jgi:gamma-glutamylputrescine oxidase
MPQTSPLRHVRVPRSRAPGLESTACRMPAPTTPRPRTTLPVIRRSKATRRSTSAWSAPASLGCAAALELAERGFRVALLEAERVGWGASGRSGGQAIFGFGTSMDTLAAQVGPETARRMWDVSIEALDWIRDRVARHGIDCDLHWGHLHVATKPRQRDELLELQRELAAVYGYHSPRFLERHGVEALLATTRYCAGLFDPRSGHLHPLNYTLGLARAAVAAGVTIFESSPVTRIERGDPRGWLRLTAR